jgi:hypothetical protein
MSQEYLAEFMGDQTPYPKYPRRTAGDTEFMIQNLPA